jgi:hypothetical protein
VRTGTAIDDALLSWRNVVVTNGPKGRERVLLGAADLDIWPAECVGISAGDAAAQEAIVAVLTGHRPRYGTVRGRAVRGRRRPGRPRVHLIVPDGLQTSAADASEMLDDGGAVVVVTVGPQAALTTCAVSRRLVLAAGCLRSISPEQGG